MGLWCAAVRTIDKGYSVDGKLYRRGRPYRYYFIDSAVFYIFVIIINTDNIMTGIKRMYYFVLLKLKTLCQLLESLLLCNPLNFVIIYSTFFCNLSKIVFLLL